MVRLTRDVEQMVRRCGRNPRIHLLLGVLSVRERSPDACFDAQEKK